MEKPAQQPGATRQRGRAPRTQAAGPPARTGAGREDLGEFDQLARLAGVGELLAELVHEVRNGLVSIKTFVQLLPEHRDDPEFEDRFRGITEDEFERIERLLATVLEQARGRGPRAIGGDTATLCEPAEAIDSVAQLASLRAKTRGVSLGIEKGDPAFVGIASDALRQVLLNLLVNALAVSERGGEVRVVSTRRGALYEICVHDEGPGVGRDLREQIFEPSFSTRRDTPGGLGLAISRRLIEDAGGTLTVRDREGGGSTFRIRLPLALPDEAER